MATKKRKRSLSTSELDQGQLEFTIPNIMALIINITYWRELGLQLGLSSARLDSIQYASSDPEDAKLRMITVWKKTEHMAACWEKLVRALTSPTMHEINLAKNMAKRCGISFEDNQYREPSSEDPPFNEANVRNIIVNVKHTRLLGEHLKMLPGILDDIDKLPIEQRKEKLVAEIFKVLGRDSSNWEILRNAIKLTQRLDHYSADGTDILSTFKSYDEDIYKDLLNQCKARMLRAAKEGDLLHVKTSLKIGVHPDARENDEYAWTALLWACEKGHRDVVDYLLERDADADVEDTANWTGLILSSRRGYLEIVRMLLDKGAKVNQLTNVKWSSLLWTAQEGHTEVARLLLERRADPKIPDKNGFTPLIQASQDGHLGVVKLLVEQIPIAELDVKTNTDWSAIMVATKNDHEDIVQYLTEKKFDIHYSNKDDVTALHIASFKGHNSIIRYMCLEAKMDVNAQDTDGVTPLMFAAKQGDLQVVRTLVENGRADVNISENDSGWTAPFFSLEGIENRDLEVLDYLLRSGRVDISHKDKNEHTIVDIARTIKPKALDVLSKYNKAETEKMISQSQSKPLVNMKNYQRLFEAMNNKVAAQPRKTVAVM